MINGQRMGEDDIWKLIEEEEKEVFGGTSLSEEEKEEFRSIFKDFSNFKKLDKKNYRYLREELELSGKSYHSGKIEDHYKESRTGWIVEMPTNLKGTGTLYLIFGKGGENSTFRTRVGSYDLFTSILPSNFSINKTFFRTTYTLNIAGSFVGIPKEYYEEVKETFLKLKEKLIECKEYILKKRREEREAKEKLRIKKLKKSQSNYLKEFDKDKNGIVDNVEGTDELMNLVRKHQKKIIEVDKTYVQNLIKISNYLKIKRENIQAIFTVLKKTKDQSELENYAGFLKNKIHEYEQLVFHSLNMVASISEDDLITFYEIYEAFDKLGMFNSNWENEVSEKLSNIGSEINGLMYSVNDMSNKVVNGLNKLTYVTQESFRTLESNLTRELDSVNSSIKFNNLLTGISTYQLYKINKQTKGLLK